MLLSMKFWDRYKSWEEAEEQWEKGAKTATQTSPIKKLKVLPQMPGVTKETAKNLKWKSLKYMVAHDQDRAILKHFLKHPFRYGFRYLNSLFKKESYKRDEDFFLYSTPSVQAFEKALQDKNSLLVIGFSYCQKPHECPSGRFTDQCLYDPNNSVCRQCDIGKTLNALPTKDSIIPLIIPTVHYIGEKIFEIVHKYPKKKVLFLITACELTLKMFGDWGCMAGIQGIGVRLDGRICNTLRAFELSEKGVKPGLTVVTSQTQKRILDLVKHIRSNASA
ncbi:MAG: hypothetical protein S4CHLAM123_15170 [Chlamydiales bacterium]|nr:hypothetical protein [Chlamydiales bacterium]